MDILGFFRVITILFDFEELMFEFFKYSRNASSVIRWMITITVEEKTINSPVNEHHRKGVFLREHNLS